MRPVPPDGGIGFAVETGMVDVDAVGVRGAIGDTAAEFAFEVKVKVEVEAEVGVAVGVRFVSAGVVVVIVVVAIAGAVPVAFVNADDVDVDVDVVVDTGWIVAAESENEAAAMLAGVGVVGEGTDWLGPVP